MEPLSINSKVKALDFTVLDPCLTCGQSPEEILCIACPSSVIPHVRHGLEGICETCAGKSLVTTGEVDEDLKDPVKVMSEIQDRVVFPLRLRRAFEDQRCLRRRRGVGRFLRSGFRIDAKHST